METTESAEGTLEVDRAAPINSVDNANDGDDDEILRNLQASMPSNMIIHPYSPELAAELSAQVDAELAARTPERNGRTPAPMRVDNVDDASRASTTSTTSTTSATDATNGASTTPLDYRTPPEPLVDEDLRKIFEVIRTSVTERKLDRATRDMPLNDVAVHLGDALDVIGQIAVAVSGQDANLQRNVCAQAIAAFAGLAARISRSLFEQKMIDDEVTSELALMNLVRTWGPRYSDGPFVIRTFSALLLPSTVQEFDTVIDEGSFEWLTLEAREMCKRIDELPEDDPASAAIKAMPSNVRANLRAHVGRISNGELPFGWRRARDSDVPQQRFPLALLLDQRAQQHILGVSDYAHAWLVNMAQKRMTILDSLLATGGDVAGNADAPGPGIDKALRKRLKAERAHLEPISRGILPWGFQRVIASVAEAPPQ